MKEYRPLTPSEQAKLSAQGCSAADWNLISVSADFSVERVRGCRFEGRVEIGADVTIFNVASYIKNYRIGDGARIINVGVLETNGRSSFGEGVRVATINEAGGREVPLYCGLTAQTAYMIALYRHRRKMVERMMEMIDREVEARSDIMGEVGRGASITNCNIIRNVRIGECAVIDGVSLLSNGTVESYEASPSRLGVNVRMVDFVTADGAQVEDGASLRRCFVGEGVKIGNFTAVDSLFFANSHCENGEACSIFAGPYTVSHHKSSLLIAGMFSFFNAGSGSNQSNHLFKTGPVHQGIHQRGCKFASDAYMMLPVKNGAFTVILGRHKNHPDTENFPYSYLIENDEATTLIPAHNLVSYGTVRDIAKWPRRDARKGEKRDMINFEECSPFVAERILSGLAILKDLGAKEIAPVYNYGRMRIKAAMLRRGVKLYTLARSKFIGTMLAYDCPEGVEADGRGHWVDVAGEYMPLSAMERIISDVEEGRVNSTAELSARFATEHELYGAYARSWAMDRLGVAVGHEPTPEDVAQVIEMGEKATAELRAMAEKDREKDMDEVMKISYGADSLSAEDIKADFDAVRKG